MCSSILLACVASARGKGKEGGEKGRNKKWKRGTRAEEREKAPFFFPFPPPQ